MHLIVTRPEPDASTLAGRLAALGVTTTLAPLLRVVPCPPETVPLDGVATLVATSRNALTVLATHDDLPRMTRLPLVVVGPGTARVARELGFSDVTQGPGAAAGLPDVLAERRAPLAILRGETTAFDLAGALRARGLDVREVVLYRTRAPEALPEPAAAALRTGIADGVVLMSPETAKVFTMLVQGADLTSALPRLTYFCLSPAVARAAAAPGGSRVLVARKPNLEEMLALITSGASQSR